MPAWTSCTWPGAPDEHLPESPRIHRQQYHGGLNVVPILLAANLFLGIYLNMSIWYKLSGKTGYGAWLSILGALITIVFNLWLIPEMGFTGAAWATFICYTSMMLLSYLKGQQVFPVPYEIGKLVFMMGSAALFWQIFGVGAGSIP